MSDSIINGPIKITGASITDTVYTLTLPDGQETTWNVTRIWEGIKRGRFGSVPCVWTQGAPPPDAKAAENLDWDKVEYFKRNPRLLGTAAVAIQGEDEREILCFVDGNHRLAAMHALGIGTFVFWLVPREVEKEYRVTWERLDRRRWVWSKGG